MVDEKTREIARRGEEIYEQKLRATLEQTHWCKYVAIELESENYFLGETLSEAMQAARKAHPGRVSFGMRIGEPIYLPSMQLRRETTQNQTR